VGETSLSQRVALIDVPASSTTLGPRVISELLLSVMEMRVIDPPPSDERKIIEMAF
jgi:hypothetical protein